MSVRILLPRPLELNVELAQRLGWRGITWTKSGSKIYIVGVPPGGEVTKLLPDFTGNPGLFFDLAKEHGLCVTRPVKKWIVTDWKTLSKDPFLDSFPAEELVDDPGCRIVEMAIAAMDLNP